MVQDYYQILGVGRDADPEEIHQAYRASAKRSHPDLSDRHEDAEFLKVKEAYDTLIDREKRREYDRRLEGGGPTVREVRTDRREARGGGRRRPSVYPVDDPAEGFGFPGRAAYQGRRYSRELHLDLALTPEEAYTGVSVPVEVCFSVPCPSCGRWVPDPFCFHCGGSGLVRERRRLTLEVPPGVGHGDLVRFGSGYTGLPGTGLVARVSLRSGFWSWW